MIPWALIGRALVPGGGELRLMQRGINLDHARNDPADEQPPDWLGGSASDLFVRQDKGPQTATYPHRWAGHGFHASRRPHRRRPDARITVAELVPAVVAWARGPLAGIFKAALKDPRLDIYEGDVGWLIGSSRLTYDAILLDVDNGPEGLTRKANDKLYDLEGLRAARCALKPCGILAVWSSTPSKPFTERLRASGFSADQIKIHASTSGGARSVIWIARPVDERHGGQA